jgi:hypothetical protein
MRVRSNVPSTNSLAIKAPLGFEVQAEHPRNPKMNVPFGGRRLASGIVKQLLSSINVRLLGSHDNSVSAYHRADSADARAPTISLPAQRACSKRGEGILRQLLHGASVFIGRTEHIQELRESSSAGSNQQLPSLRLDCTCVQSGNSRLRALAPSSRSNPRVRVGNCNCCHWVSEHLRDQ